MPKYLVKLAIGAVGLAALFYLGALDPQLLLEAADRPWLIVGAFLLLLATVPIAAMRWWSLLRALDYDVTPGWAFNITFVSLFFNTFLPGSYGGDLVRMAMGHRAAGSLNRMALSILVDRLSGLMALILLGLAVTPGLPGELGQALTQVAVVIMALSAVAIFVFLRFNTLIASLLRRIPARVGHLFAHVVIEVGIALRMYLSRPGALIGAVAISALQYVLIVIAVVMIGYAMHFAELSYPAYTIASVWGLLAAALPISPGGLGVGEAAFAQVAVILSSGGGAGYGTIFLGMRVLNILIGAVGVIPFLLNRTELTAARKSASHSSVEKDGRVAG